jgi:hypothetical protein
MGSQSGGVLSTQDLLPYRKQSNGLIAGRGRVSRLPGPVREPARAAIRDTLHRG